MVLLNGASMVVYGRLWCYWVYGAKWCYGVYGTKWCYGAMMLWGSFMVLNGAMGFVYGASMVIYGRLWCY